MNERIIKQLAEQAGINIDSFQFSGTPIKHIVDEPSLEKFAELIVEEMYDFMCKATENDGAWPTSKEVKQHFGVNGMSTEDKKTLIKELLGVKE